MNNRFIKLLGGALTAPALTTPIVRAEMTAKLAVQSAYLWRGIFKNAEAPSFSQEF